LVDIIIADRTIGCLKYNELSIPIRNRDLVY
jgi:hypothetical protein